MENNLSINEIVSKQSAFFKSHATKDINFRKQALKRLKAEVIKREKDIVTALYEDLKKPEFEAVLTETEVVLAELNLSIKNLNSWAKPKRIFPSMLNFPSTDKIY
ncbi:MAG: aldehyde dehydrogenase, partial [Chlorobi bacterium]|nr:aldehyde dehydrogenase [Chlorobiota bacterium]